MALIDRAIEFTESGGSRVDQGNLLAECVQALNLDGLAAVERLYEDMYGGITFNFELKVAPAICLLHWEEEGLNALVEGAKRTPTSKNISIAIQLLSSLAAGTLPIILTTFVEKRLQDGVLPLFRQSSPIGAFARQKLTEFMLSFPDDFEASAAAGHAFQQLSVLDTTATKEVFGALASRWLAVGKPVLAELQDLITKYEDDEPRFQAFFEKVPQLLDPLAMQVWPMPDLHGAKEPDFVVKRADGTYSRCRNRSALEVNRYGTVATQRVCNSGGDASDAVSIISPGKVCRSKLTLPRIP
jgi:hypothetical protein